MKKATLLLFIFLISVSGFAQLAPEGFEGGFPPTNWLIINNGGPNVTWAHSQLGNPQQPPHTGDRAAYLNREISGTGITEDWLVTPAFPAPANAQLRFWSRLTIGGNQGTIYEIRVSTNPIQNSTTDYTVIQTWTEPQINPSQETYVEKLVPLTGIPAGQQIYVAFVMRGTGNNGDRWLIDDVSVDEKCLDPTALTANNITQTSADLSWGNPSGATSWEIEVVPAATAPTGAGVVYNGTLPYVAGGLTQDTDYKFYVRARCSSTNLSEWVGPFNFGTVSPGATCAAAIQVTTLPYTTTDNTSNYGDDYGGSPGATGCGSTSAYLNGDDVVYSYTAPADGAISIGITGNGTYAGLFVYNSCANIGVSCIAGGVSGSSSNPVSIPLLSVTAGTTYYIVISTWATPQSTPYTLTIGNVDCPPPTNLSVSGLTSTSANLSWAGNGSTAWEIVIQAAGAGAPAGAGTAITTNNYPATQTTAGVAFTPSTAYEYYVRGNCPSGFSTWSGPFVFNTTQIPGTLNYIDGFEGTPSWTLLNGSQTNKWVIGSAVNNGGTQSLYISNDNGTTNAYTLTSASTVQAYRDIQFPAAVNEVSLTFDWRAVGEGTTTDYFRVWLVPTTFIPTPGTQITAANSGGVQIGANFNQSPAWVTTASYVINASAFAGDTRRLVFEWRNSASGGTQPPAAIDNINLSIITCSAPSAPVASNVTLNTATLSWTPPVSAVAGYDYYYSTSNTAPTASTTPNGNVSAATADISGLSPSTNYFAWVRSNCGVDGTSFWVGPVAFNTPQIPGTLNYVDGFEGTPSWTILNGTQPNKWVIGSAVSNGGTQSLYISNDNGASNAYTITTTSVVQAYRDITLPSTVNEINLSFDWRAVGEGTTTLYDYFRVWIVPVTFVPTPGTQITAANSGGVQVGGSFNQNPNWITANYVLNASAYAGETRRLVFEWRNDSSAGTPPPAAIDNINISIITCSAPTNLVVNSLTENSATLSWTAPAVAPGNYEYYYSTTNTPPTASTVPAGSVSGTTTTVTVPGLTPNTQYYFWVRSNCGATDGNSFWTGPASFITPQIPATLTYNEGFEGATTEWALNNGTQTNKWVVGSAVSNGGTQSLYISNNNGVANAYTLNSTSTVQAYRDILFPAGANEVNLSFDWRAVGEGTTTKYDYFRVWLVPVTYVPTAGTLITAGNGRVQIGGSFNQNGTWTTAVYPIDASGFDGEIRRLVFEWRNDGGGGTQPPAAIDNISLIVATCPRPINVESSCASSTSANFTWQQGGSETSWEIALLPATAAAPTSGTVVTDPLYYAENLTVNTAYTFYVRAICSGTETSLWAEVDFTTFSSSVLESTPFCASQNPEQYILFNNVNDAMNVPSYGDVACLGSTPNPVWYYLQVEDPGTLNFQLIQNTAFTNGNPTGTGLDVDFVAFGPFNSLNEACGQIVLDDCPTCPNNTTNQAFYPFGNIVDCSFSAAPIENFTIPNAQEGEIYAVLITNYNGDPGQIKLQQLASSTGTTNCNILYSVELGNNQSLCGVSTATITAAVSTPGNAETVDNYEWFMDGVEYTPTVVSSTPQSQTISVSDPGSHVYSVIVSVANAGNTEPITDQVTVVIVPDFTVPAPATVNLCGTTTGTVDLATLTAGILGTLNPADFVVEYYPTLADANAGTNQIDISVPFTTPSQTIYVRVESAILATCFEVVPLPIVVNATGSADISYADSPYCSNETTGTVTLTGSTGGTFTAEPAAGTTGTIVIDPVTGTIDIAASTAGTYTVTYTIAATPVCDAVEDSFDVVIVEAPAAAISYENSPYCSNGGTATVTHTGTTGGTYSSTTGLVIDAATGDIDLAASTAGTYTVTYTVPAGTVCGVAPFTAQVTITALPVATIDYGTTPYCSNAGAATVTQTGTTGGTYSSTAGLVINAATGEIDLDASTAGTYTVTYTLPAGSGCTPDPVTASITITALPVATFTYDSASYCVNFPSTVAPTFGTGAIAGTFTVDHAGLTIDTATGQINPATSTPGVYLVTNTVAAANGCPAVPSLPFEVTIIAAPIPDFSYSQMAYCQEETTDASPIFTTGEAGTFSATPSGLVINASTGVIDLSESESGTYQVTNTIAATADCGEVPYTVDVVINATPVFVFSDGCDGNTYKLEIVDIEESFVIDNATYAWTGPDGFTAATAEIEPVKAGDYTVTVTTPDGCTNTMPFTVETTSCLIQKGISPGDDDKNNTFDLTALDVTSLSIFNRYGQEVFSYGAYTNQWGGQDKNGNELPTGTYFYSFERANGETKTGWIYINRQN